MKIIRKKGLDRIKVSHNRGLFWLIIVLLILFIIFLIYSSIQFNKNGESEDDVKKGSECVVDSDCVPEICCHAASCVPKERAPDCGNLMCTMECTPNSMDCGEGRCGCVNGYCDAIFI